MNKEIRNNEIHEEELENVSGGEGIPTPKCPKCGAEMMVVAPLPGTPCDAPKSICLACRHAEW